MSNSELQVIKNEDFHIHKGIKFKTTTRRGYFIRFTIFILIILSLFSGIFFVKDRFQSIRDTEENLNLQKQRLMEERLAMENTFKNESDKLLKSQIEYENKNKELTDVLNSVKIKEETLNSELLKIGELKELLVKQLVDIYNLNINTQYRGSDDKVNEGLNGGASEEDKIVSSMQSSVVGGIVDSEDLQSEVNRVLGIANADWLIKFDSLGEFSY